MCEWSKQNSQAKQLATARYTEPSLSSRLIPAVDRFDVAKPNQFQQMFGWNWRGWRTPGRYPLKGGKFSNRQGVAGEQPQLQQFAADTSFCVMFHVERTAGAALSFTAGGLRPVIESLLRMAECLYSVILAANGGWIRRSGGSPILSSHGK
jgi:hypothetical protein